MKCKQMHCAAIDGSKIDSLFVAERALQRMNLKPATDMFISRILHVIDNHNRTPTHPPSAPAHQNID